MDLNEVFEALLEKLDSVRGSAGCTLVSHDGLILASHVDRSFPSDKIAANGAQMVSMCKRVTDECGFGKPVLLLIEGEEGKLAVLNADRQLGYIFLFGHKEMNVGMARVALQDTILDHKK